MLDLELLELSVECIGEYVGDSIEIIGWSNECIVLTNRGIVREIPFGLLDNALATNPYMFDYCILKEFGLVDKALSMENEYIAGMKEALSSEGLY